MVLELWTRSRGTVNSLQRRCPAAGTEQVAEGVRAQRELSALRPKGTPDTWGAGLGSAVLQRWTGTG